MSGKPCKRCNKTAYPLESIKAGEETYHKLCFKCPEDKCNVQLTLKTFKRDPETGLAFCEKHVPKAKHTQVADSVLTKTALNAPKRTTEKGIHKADPKVAPKHSNEWTNDRHTESGELESNPEQSSADTGSSFGSQAVQSGTFENEPEPSHAETGGSWGSRQVESGTYESNPEPSHAGAGGSWGQQHVETSGDD